jgi:5-methylcytosine-specific restriction endonuclease McrA
MRRQIIKIYTADEIAEISKLDYRGNAFYNSAGWRNLTHKIRATRNNECELCKSRGKVGLDFGRGLICHHINPLRTFPQFAYDENNIKLLCLPCHDETHRLLDGDENSRFLADNVTRVKPKKRDKFSDDEKW